MTYGFPKSTTAARKKDKLERRAKLEREERDAKAEVRRRDKVCRFPMCGCRKLGLVLKAFAEVSHSKHKGMGGNPEGDRSTPELMMLLCKHRHQDGWISRHSGRLEARPIDAARGFNGPVEWWIDIVAVIDIVSEHGFEEVGGRLVRMAEHGTEKTLVAVETAPGVIEPPGPWQLAVLKQLAQMVA